MVDGLLATLGIYGATFAIAFIAGLFPLVSIEACLVLLTLMGRTPPVLAVLIALAAVGHQIAKTVTYYAGDKALNAPGHEPLTAAGRKARRMIEKARGWVERWNRWPRSVLFLASTVGVPPLYAIGFVARPLMKLSIWTFTAVSLTGRVLRFIVLVVVTRQF